MATIVVRYTHEPQRYLKLERVHHIEFHYDRVLVAFHQKGREPMRLPMAGLNIETVMRDSPVVCSVVRD